MSQASTTAAVAAVNTQQQQQQQAAFITDPKNDPYPKWSPSPIGTIQSATDSYQSKFNLTFFKCWNRFLWSDQNDECKWQHVHLCLSHYVHFFVPTDLKPTAHKHTRISVPKQRFSWPFFVYAILIIICRKYIPHTALLTIRANSIVLQYGPTLASFSFISSFSHHNSITNEKSVDGVLVIRTWGCRMVGADETTELWRPLPIALLVRQSL